MPHLSRRPTSEDGDTSGLHEKETHLVASAATSSQRARSSFVIKEPPEEKQLGISARTLRINDFELLKTLGTGQLIVAEGMRQMWSWSTHWCTGTFARVWLARLKSQKEKRDRVFALKVLRKADGESLFVEGRKEACMHAPC